MNSINTMSTPSKEAEAENINDSETLDQAIERLSTLPILESYLLRVPESDKLNISPAELDQQVLIKFKEIADAQADEDNKEPAMMKPDDLAQCIKMIVNQYTVLEEDESVAITLWIMFTWLHEHATISPILNISSPEKRCGKTTVLTVIKKMCYSPIPASNISPAAMYRTIEQDSPTLVIDEADTFASNSHELRGIINSGHSPDLAFVRRCVGESLDPADFSTWCPKVIAGIGQLPETVMDRSIIIEMKRKLPSQKIVNIRRADNKLFEAIQYQLTHWSLSITENFKGLIPNEIAELNDRANDNWEPLLAIANTLGGNWNEDAIKSALKLSSSQEDTLSNGEQLLTDIHEVLLNFPHAAIGTNVLIPLLSKDDEKLWQHYDKGRNITAAQLSKMLRPFHIKSTHIRDEKKKQVRGYYLNYFSDAFKRYVPENSVTGVTDVDAPEETGSTSTNSTMFLENTSA